MKKTLMFLALALLMLLPLSVGAFAASEVNMADILSNKETDWTYNQDGSASLYVQDGKTAIDSNNAIINPIDLSKSFTISFDLRMDFEKVISEPCVTFNLKLYSTQDKKEPYYFSRITYDADFKTWTIRNQFYNADKVWNDIHEQKNMYFGNGDPKINIVLTRKAGSDTFYMEATMAGKVIYQYNLYTSEFSKANYFSNTQAVFAFFADNPIVGTRAYTISNYTFTNIAKEIIPTEVTEAEQTTNSDNPGPIVLNPITKDTKVTTEPGGVSTTAASIGSVTTADQTDNDHLPMYITGAAVILVAAVIVIIFIVRKRKK